MIVITAPTGHIGRHLLPLLLESAPVHGEQRRVYVTRPGCPTRCATASR